MAPRKDAAVTATRRQPGRAAKQTRVPSIAKPQPAPKKPAASRKAQKASAEQSIVQSEVLPASASDTPDRKVPKLIITPGVYSNSKTIGNLGISEDFSSISPTAISPKTILAPVGVLNNSVRAAGEVAPLVTSSSTKYSRTHKDTMPYVELRTEVTASSSPTSYTSKAGASKAQGIELANEMVRDDQSTSNLQTDHPLTMSKTPGGSPKSTDFSRDVATEEELQIARAFENKQLSQGFPWDFQVPFGYEGLVKRSGQPVSSNIVFETIKWKYFMRSSEWATLAQRVHESVHGSNNALPSSSMFLPSMPSNSVADNKKRSREEIQSVSSPPHKKIASVVSEFDFSKEAQVSEKNPSRQRRKDLRAKIDSLKAKRAKIAHEKATALRIAAEKIEAEKALRAAKAAEDAKRMEDAKAAKAAKVAEAVAKLKAKAAAIKAREEQAAAVATKKKATRKAPPQPLNIVQPSDTYLQIHAGGKGSDFQRALDEHHGKLPLTSSESLRLEKLTKADMKRLDGFYAANQRAGIIPWLEAVPFGYPGLTRWKWPGPRVLELVDWRAKQATMRTRRELVMDRVGNSNRQFTAADNDIVKVAQIRIADMVLRTAELEGIIPLVYDVPYGFAGYVLDAPNGRAFRVRWDPEEAHKWEYKVLAEGVYWRKWNTNPKGMERSWWREMLDDSNGGLARAQEEGYIPYRAQIVGEYKGQCRELDWDGWDGKEMRVYVSEVK